LGELFEDDDIVWIGDLHHSGQPYHKDHFRPAREWKAKHYFNHNFISPNVWRRGIYSRCKEAVLRRKYLVVESDILTKDEVGAIFAWARQFMRLRAIVDTGGRSLHAWFEYPQDPEIMSQLEIILPALDCDPKMLNASQPCRMPGVVRREKRGWQELVWLDGRAQ
jgi:hypothetical protein